jgi:hypothetical protein
MEVSVVAASVRHIEKVILKITSRTGSKKHIFTF